MKNPLAFLFSKEENENHVPNNEILSYAVGLAGQNVSYSFISNRLTYFYENHAVSGDKAHIVGKILSVSHVWDAANDVFIGGYIDRKKHKPFNKLRPYLFAPVPFVGLLSAMLFMSFGTSDTLKLIYLCVCYFLWDFLYSFQDVSLWGLIALSSPNSHERSRVAQWVSIGAGAGGVIGGAFPIFWDILKGMGVREKTVFMMFAVIFGLGGEIVSMRAHKFHERIDAPRQNDTSFFESIAVLKHNPTLLLISAARIAQDLYPRINNTYFFQSEYRGATSSLLKGGTAETLFGMLSGIPGSVSIFFATKIIDRLGGMKKTLLCAQLSVIICRVTAFFVCRIPVLRHNTLPGFITMSLLLSASSILTGLSDIAHRSLTSDSIDEVELKTGIRSEGVSFSMQNFTSKLGAGMRTYLQNFFLFKVLGYKSYDDENYIEMQSEKFYKWQYPLFMVGPVIGSLLYILFISFIKYSRERTDEIERLLRERRESVNSQQPEDVTVQK